MRKCRLRRGEKNASAIMQMEFYYAFSARFRPFIRCASCQENRTVRRRWFLYSRRTTIVVGRQYNRVIANKINMEKNYVSRRDNASNKLNFLFCLFNARNRRRTRFPAYKYNSYHQRNITAKKKQNNRIIGIKLVENTFVRFTVFGERF